VRLMPRLAGAPVTAILCLAGGFTWAAAPHDIEIERNGVIAGPAVIAPPRVYELGTEMVVRNWVLCVSREVAEQLARARERGAEQAQTTYAGLSGNRSCGQVETLLVILRKRLYTSPVSSGHDARVFAAEVRLSDNWAAAFVVYGGLPDE